MSFPAVTPIHLWVARSWWSRWRWSRDWRYAVTVPTDSMVWMLKQCISWSLSCSWHIRNSGVISGWCPHQSCYLQRQSEKILPDLSVGCSTCNNGTIWIFLLIVQWTPFSNFSLLFEELKSSNPEIATSSKRIIDLNGSLSFLRAPHASHYL
jgi:hypothetical protein